MNKLKEIGEGWLNNLLRDNPEIEEQAKERLAICSSCPNRITMLGVDVCALCHCPLSAKARSQESECPAGKW